MGNTLELVPEVFFDVIARLVPGAVLLFGLAAIVPEARLACAQALRDPELLPPLGFFIPLAVTGAWVVGFLLSIASSPIENLYHAGYDPICDALKCTNRGARPALRCFEMILGFPVILLVRYRRVYYEFGEDISNRAEPILKRVFCCSKCSAIPFWLLFDYVRANAPVSASSAVVKSLAEATCAKSLMLCFLILAFASWHYYSSALLILLFVLLATTASTGLSMYRVQTRHRMLFSLLNSEGQPANREDS